MATAAEQKRAKDTLTLLDGIVRAIRAHRLGAQADDAQSLAETLERLSKTAA